MALSQALKEIYASPPAADGYAETLSFDHVTMASPVYVTNQPVGFQGILETGASVFFAPVGFRLTLPKRDHSGRQDLQITLDNIGKALSSRLEAANEEPREQITCGYRVYLWSNKSAPQNDAPLILTISDVVVTARSCTMRATRADVLNRAFPRVLYRTDTFPGLAR